MENAGGLQSIGDPGASAVLGLFGMHHDHETSGVKATAAGGTTRGRAIDAPGYNVDDTQALHVGDAAGTLLAIANTLAVERRLCELSAHPRETMGSDLTWPLVSPSVASAALVETESVRARALDFSPAGVPFSTASGRGGFPPFVGDGPPDTGDKC